MRFYADENFPLPVVAELRRLGHDILTAFEDGRANQGIEDDKVLARALILCRVVLTNNRVDFKHLHYAGHEHAGIVLCTFDIDFPGQAERIHETCTQASELKGTVTRVNRGN